MNLGRAVRRRLPCRFLLATAPSEDLLSAPTHIGESGKKDKLVKLMGLSIAEVVHEVPGRWVWLPATVGSNASG